MVDNESDDMFDYCLKCSVGWIEHPKRKATQSEIENDEILKVGKYIYECDELAIIEGKKPRFYIIDLNNYINEFLIEIILWQDEKIKILERRNKSGGENEKL